MFENGESFMGDIFTKIYFWRDNKKTAELAVARTMAFLMHGVGIKTNKIQTAHTRQRTNNKFNEHHRR